MGLKISETVAMLLAAVVAGMFLGPWVALSRSMRTFEADVFLAIVQRMNSNMGPFMSVLMPVTLASLLPVL